MIISSDTKPNNELTEKIYILSGLGADRRVFQKLDFSNFSVTFIDWIVPHKFETIENYATRLLDQIKTPIPTLLGLSFGGIMAIEVAKQINTKQVILISSAKTKSEIPFYFRFAGRLGLHTLLPSKFMKTSNFITNWFFGASSSFEKELLKQILTDTNTDFLKWAIDQIVRWQNQKQVKNVTHIHGTSDRILPFKFANGDIAIKNGGHLMTLSKAKEINNILMQQLIQ